MNDNTQSQKDPSALARWEKVAMSNQAMKRKLEKGEALNISACPRTVDLGYILENVVDGMDYCNAATEEWIWVIFKNKATKQITAYHWDDNPESWPRTKLKDKENFELLWLR